MKLRVIWAFALIGFLYQVSTAQGIIIPDDCHRCPPFPRPIPRPHPLPRVLKVKSVKITTKIDSQVASTRVEQIFENDTPYMLEGSYFFPIPESASISDFAIYDGDKRMAAEIMEKGKARRIYNDIVRRMIDPGLLEYAGKDLFQASIFPIEPRSTRKIELSYSQVIKGEAGVVAYRYDLGSGRRMMTQPIGQIAAIIEIDSPTDLKNIYSPSHKISVSRDGERRARLSFEGSGEEAQKDFLLYYTLSEKEFGLSLITHREPGKDGYFLMILSPKVNIGEQERLAKDVVFVLDTSGSMSGEKLDKAKAALRFGVESLSPRDRFNIISFSGEEHLMKRELVEASTEAQREARSFIDNLRAEGGTNINDALMASFKQFQASSRPAMIVFVTDGQPTVGTTDPKQILKNAADSNRTDVRLFCFGVGYDVNTNLLDKLSSENRGASDYIEPDEDLEVKVSSFFAKVNYPVLSDLKLDFGGAETDLVYPRVLPDLFKGSQLTLVGRYKNSLNSATVRLNGRVGSRNESFVFNGQSFPSERSSNDFLPRLWATRRVGHILEQIRLNGENRELVDEVVALGTRFGIVTPYTSFLVTDDIKDIARRPAQLPRVMRAPRMIDSGSPAAPSAAVGRSKIEAEFKTEESINLPDQYLPNVKTVASKSFILENGFWIDTDYRDNPARMKTIEVKFGSEAFFDLISKEPRLAAYFAVGRNVIVVFEKVVYKVN